MPVLSPVARGMAKDRLEDDPTRSPADRTAVTRAVRALARAAVRRRERGETHREHWDLSRPRQPGPAAELHAVRRCLSCAAAWSRARRMCFINCSAGRITVRRGFGGFGR